MADESFILTLVGQLDEKGTKDNIANTLNKINKEIGQNNLGTIKIFDKNELDRQGSLYLSGISDIKKQITELLKLDENTGVSIAKIFDDNGAIAKFKVSLQDAIGVLREYNFERAKFSDGTVGAVMTSGTGVNPVIQVANGYNTLNQNIQKASGSVKVFTQESIDGLKKLETRVQQTNQIVSKPNFDVSNSWFANDVGSIEEFAKKYEQIVNKINGAPDITKMFDNNNNILGFTANITTAEGAVQQLKYRLTEVENDFGGKDSFFQFTGSTVLDNAFTKQAEAIGNLESKVKSFKEKLNDGVTFKFIDTTDTVNNLQIVENIIQKLKTNVGLNNIVDIENLEKALGLIIETANETEKVEKKKQSEIDKTTTKINRQNKQLETTRVLLESWEKTKINPDSASFIGNSDKLEEVKTKLQEVMKLRSDLAKDNDGKLIISDERMNKLTVGLSELRLLMSEARKESGQSIDRNESVTKLARDIELATSKLDAYIAKWKNMGVYSGKLKADSEALKATLTTKGDDGNYLIKSSAELGNLNKQIQIYNNNAIEMQRAAKGTKESVAGSTQSLESQRKYLELTLISLKEYKREVTDSSSLNPLQNNENLKEAITLIELLENKLEVYKTRNSKGEIISNEKINQLVIDLARAKSTIDVFYDAETKLFSEQNTATKIDLYREKLTTLEQKYSEIIAKSEEFRNAFNSVKSGLNGIKTPEELKAWEQEFKKMQEAAKRTGAALKNAIKTDELSQKVDLLRQQINAFEQSNPRAANIYAEVFERLKKALDSVANSGDLKKIQNEFRSLKITIDQAGVSGKTFGQRMQDAFKRMSSYLGVTSMMMYTVRAVREIINNVKELDTQMVRLRRVTEETDTTYKNMFNNAVKSAKELNTSVKDIIESTAEFAKLGFDTQTSAKLSELANMYNRVGELGSIETATKDLVSAINGFKDLTADDAETIIDVMDNIGNRFPVAAKDLGEILQRSSASLSEANNSMQEAVALGTAGFAVTQDAAKVGTALKTLSLRIRGATTQLEQDGLDTEGMITATADLRKLVLASTGVDILEKDQQTFRSTYEILVDISKVWQDIGDLERSALLQKLAGKQQAQVLAAILNNGEMLEQVYKEAMDSAGTAQAEQEKWADSVEAKMGRVSATFESISANMLSSDTFKNALDTINRILDGIDALTKSGMGAIPVFTSLAGLMGTMGNGFFSFQNMNQSKALIDAYNNSLSLSAAEQTKFQNSLAQTNPRFAAYVGNLNGAKAELKDYNSYLGKTAVSTAWLTVKTVALNMAINAGIGAIIGLVTTGLSKLINHQKEVNQTFVDATSSVKNFIEPLDGYKEKIESVIKSDVDETDKLKQLNAVKDELSEKYRREIDDIKNVADARRILNDVIEEETENELGKYYLENNKNFKNQSSRLKSVGENVLNDNLLFGGKGKADISEDIQKLFGVFDVYQNDSNYNIEANINGKNVFEYYDNLERAILKIDEIRNKSAKGLTKSEELLYKELTDRYNILKDIVDNDDFSIDDFNDSADAMARYYMSIVPRGTQSTEEWKKSLFNLNEVANDQFLKDAIENMLDAIDAEERLADVSGKTVNPLAELLSNLQKVGNTCEQVNEEIKTADEQFEKLAKTIETNKDVDKFFSASDIIEILELYPSLNDAILETSYGYKIEEEALESLREEKVSEKKTALQAQLDEAQGLLETTRTKLNLYQQELDGIKDVADAKVKLAELDAKIAALAPEAPHHRNSAKSELEAEKAKYQDFIDTTEALQEQQKEVDTLSIKLKVLGNVFDDVKDATKDQTDELNKQKDELKELTDEYKDAKKAIEDLIKLTMDMIKKNKELQKEALKEQLDNFKKLIDKKKELIKLEQDQYNFEKDLKEQNRDLLEIQQELDSLSIEGADYSLEDLKRKEELQKQYIEQSEKRDDFLYDHEVETRTKALEDEEEAFEDQINTQIKAIEDYLQHEGKIRSDAVDLINGKSQEFYNDLLNYTMDYTSTSRYEFDKLWSDAYDAILKYAGGELDVDLALMNIIASMDNADKKLKDIEKSIEDIKNATKDAKNAMLEYQEVVSDTQAKFKQMYDSPIGPGLPNSPVYTRSQVQMAMNPNNGIGLLDLMKLVKEKHHDGGIVGGNSSEHGEILAKLLKGEVVATEGQARQFMEKTLPKLSGNSITNNNSSLAPVINMGDIVINGNADNNAIDKLKAIQKDITNSVLKAVNTQTNIFNGGRVRPV